MLSRNYRKNNTVWGFKWEAQHPIRKTFVYHLQIYSEHGHGKSPLDLRGSVSGRILGGKASPSTVLCSKKAGFLYPFHPIA